MSWAFAQLVNAHYQLFDVSLYLHRLDKAHYTLPEAVS